RIRNVFTVATEIRMARAVVPSNHLSRKSYMKRIRRKGNEMREEPTMNRKSTNNQAAMNTVAYFTSRLNLGCCSVTSSARSKMAEMGFSTARASFLIT
ncbi:MAG: hypothetical protein V3V91_08870, partial [Thermoplasmata archaeon]